MPVPLLHIIPHNRRARECFEGKENAHFFSPSVDDCDRIIKVSLGNPSKTPGCIISFGKLGDIHVLGSRISGTHFQILMHDKSHEILFRDCSTYQSSTLRNLSDERTEMLGGVPRQSVVRPDDRVLLGIGGLHKDLFQFRISWPNIGPNMQEQVQESKRQFLERPKNPAYAITADDSDTPASRYETRLQTPWDSGTRLAHRKLDTLGHGSFGIVHKAVDMHSGEHLAVKSIRLNPRQRNDYSRKTIKREVEILHGLFHPHLAEFRHSQGFQHDDDNVEIFMTLYDGNLEHLLHERPEFPQEKALIRELFRQTLSAVVYLAHKSILHRDIKPANILFSENCHWVLADFGLAKFQDEGLTRAGSGHFMAPEILSGGRQTHKVDVYSLGMTMLYSLSSHDLRQRIHGAEPLRESPDFQTALGRLSRLNALLREDPEQRSTAQQIYLGFFGDDPEILSQPPAEIPEPVSVNIFAEAARVQAPTTLGRQQPFGKRLLLNQRKIRKEARRRAAGLQD